MFYTFYTFEVNELMVLNWNKFGIVIFSGIFVRRVLKQFKNIGGAKSIPNIWSILIEKNTPLLAHNINIGFVVHQTHCCVKFSCH